MDIADWILQRLDKYGIGLVIVGSLILCAWKYGPKIVSSFIGLINTIQVNNDRMADAIDKQSVLPTAINKTHTALHRFADAAQAAADVHSEAMSDAVRPHVEAIKRVFEHGG